MAPEKYQSLNNKKWIKTIIFLINFPKNFKTFNIFAEFDFMRFFCAILDSGAICRFGAIYQSEFDLKFGIEKSIFIFSWSNLPFWSNLSRCNLPIATVYVKFLGHSIYKSMSSINLSIWDELSRVIFFIYPLLGHSATQAQRQ